MIKKLKLSCILILLFLSSCVTDVFKEQASQQFGDQHFKTAISLIELHKLREGVYPQTLDSLKYIGEWDIIIFKSVKYKKLDEGYELDVVNMLTDKPLEISYPEDFWKGLGLKKSNLKK